MIIRRLVMRDYSQKPPADFGRIDLSETGVVTLSDFGEAWSEVLHWGVRDARGSMRRYTMADGGKFLDMVLQEYQGSMVKATEVKP